MMDKQVKWGKWFALSLGGLIGLSHIGMIGSLSNRESKLPSINLPVGPYTSYKADVSHNGYKRSEMGKVVRSWFGRTYWFVSHRYDWVIIES